MSDTDRYFPLAELHQVSRTTLAQSALLDSLAGLVQMQAARIAALEEDAASLRDFVHGLNDRHTSTSLKVSGMLKLWEREGATAPRTEVSD